MPGAALSLTWGLYLSHWQVTGRFLWDTQLFKPRSMAQGKLTLDMEPRTKTCGPPGGLI